MAIIVGGSAVNFIDGVNRLLRINSIIKGDDDNITTFSDTQHSAFIELAQIAIQDELNDLVSDNLIPYEKNTDTITLVTGTRTYALNTAFVRFYGTSPSFYDSTNNQRIYELRGGEDGLKDTDYEYKTTQGSPLYWYWDDTTSNSVAFYSVPDSSYNGISLSYDYEESISLSLSTDTMPFNKNEEYQSFISMASQRFKYLVGEKDQGLLHMDATWNNAKTRLMHFLRPTNPSKYYGRRR